MHLGAIDGEPIRADSASVVTGNHREVTMLTDSAF